TAEAEGRLHSGRFRPVSDANSGVGEADLGDQHGIAASGRRTRLGAGLDGEGDGAAGLRRNAELLQRFHPVLQRLLEGRPISEGPGHLSDPAVLSIPLGAAGRIDLGVSIDQSDLIYRGLIWKRKADDLPNAVAVASPGGVRLC